MMEDYVVIYRITRSVDRRIFYIDVSNLNKARSEQYIKDMMHKYRNKMVYDVDSGTLRDRRDQLSMLEDYWLPRQDGGKGTEIVNLEGGSQLGELRDLEYIQNKLYKSLNVPMGRFSGESSGFAGIGRSSEITRDEVRFHKFIERLRNKFSELFEDLLKTQCILKNILDEKDWEIVKKNIRFRYLDDNYYSELKELEIAQERMNAYESAEPLIGKFYSHQTIASKILKMTNEEWESERELIKKEKNDKILNDTFEDNLTDEEQ